MKRPRRQFSRPCRFDGRLPRGLPKLLFLDFDGTLAPIVRHPAAAKLPASVRNVLMRLTPAVRIVFVSGRSLKDLKSRCRIRGAAYVGNHGLEMSGVVLPSDPRRRRALRQARCMPAVARKLISAFGRIPGVWIEDKGTTLTIHYRNLRPSGSARFAQALAACRVGLKNRPIVWRRGKKTWEVRPASDWNKGDAVRSILAKESSGFAVIVGDDVTDEDMFRAARRRDITIRVGAGRKSHADYRIPTPDGVAELLEALTREL